MSIGLYLGVLMWLFVLLLPVFIAQIRHANREVILVSFTLSIATIIFLIPPILVSNGMSIPNIYGGFFGADIWAWLFFINLFIVLWHKRKNWN